MSASSLSISFLIPAYNDEETIAKAVTEAVSIGERVSDRFEIIVIDDGSRDGTVAVLGELSKKIPQLHFSVHKKNKGYGETIKELYYRSRSEWLYTLPGDNQIGAEEVMRLLPYAGKADMIIGLRVNRQDTWRRLLQSRIYNALLRMLFGIHVRDVNSVRLMRSSIMKKIRLTTTSAFVDAELLIKARDEGFRAIEAPIEHRAREGTVGGGGKWYIIRPVIVDMLRFAWKRWSA